MCWAAESWFFNGNVTKHLSFLRRSRYQRYMAWRCCRWYGSSWLTLTCNCLEHLKIRYLETLMTSIANVFTHSVFFTLNTVQPNHSGANVVFLSIHQQCHLCGRHVFLSEVTKNNQINKIVNSHIIFSVPLVDYWSRCYFSATTPMRRKPTSPPSEVDQSKPFCFSSIGTCDWHRLSSWWSFLTRCSSSMSSQLNNGAMQYNYVCCLSNSRYTYDSAVFPVGLADHTICPNYWWRNILYIHTWYPFNEFCMIWSWYLANDMQYYVWSIIMLITSIR